MVGGGDDNDGDGRNAVICIAVTLLTQTRLMCINCSINYYYMYVHNIIIIKSIIYHELTEIHDIQCGVSTRQISLIR